MGERIDIESAKRDPRSAFGTPEAVVGDVRLTRDQRVEVLRQWAYDARELEVAADENMAGGEDGMLHRVAEALRALGADPDPGDAAG